VCIYVYQYCIKIIPVGVIIRGAMRTLPSFSPLYNIFLLYSSAISHIPTNKLTMPLRVLSPDRTFFEYILRNRWRIKTVS
jgi:hypothetical protein